MKPMQMIRSLAAAITLTFAASSMATPITSMVVFGDSLTDDGNTTHLLKALRQDESPAYLVHPLKAFVINKMTEYANYYYVPQSVLDAGIEVVTHYLDYEVAPYLAELVGRVRTVPILPGKPYWHNHFSNGQLWNEYLANRLNIDTYDEDSYTNKAFAGSWASTYDYQLTTWNLIRHPLESVKNLIVGKLIPPSLGLVTQAYLLEHESLDPDAAYFIFSGSNDYLGMLTFEDNYDPANRSIYVDNVIGAIDAAVERLRAKGAQHFVVIGLPDVGTSPRFTDRADKVIIKDTIAMHNQRLQDKVKLWQQTNPDVDYLYVDIESSFNKIMQTPETYGFSVTETPCIDVKLPSIRGLSQSPFPHNVVLQHAQVMQYVAPNWGKGVTNFHQCQKPDSYLFWDEIHPSTKAHALLAAEICEQMATHGYEIEC